ncbi:helix-turn-helix transcriptional regulator [Nonomuraea guangzhouensis]|uniref:AraC family transcriptional regulator n=1 Tax=Nonomuraea guangzhouensis TaxID=1291555 RepID=A0ABW4GNN3_9ACTN|nr:helix-turn-helix domain-containing protein [Nonomuraea guangzhouensis]
MHRVRRDDVFTPDRPAVVAERHELAADNGAHSHDFLELAVVVSGTATHVSVTGEQELSRGSVALLRPGDWHGYRECRELVVHNVYVGPEMFQRELAWLRAEPHIGRLLHTSGHVSRLDGGALAVVEAALPAAVGGHITQVGALLCLLGGAAASLGEPAARGAGTHPAVLLAVRELEGDPRRSWSVDDLAALAHVSSAHLARTFTAQLGISPMAYLNRLRAERAAALLIETDLPVAAIGRQVGWSDPNYASRRFRQSFAMSPSDYRARFSAPAPAR